VGDEQNPTVVLLLALWMITEQLFPLPNASKTLGVGFGLGIDGAGLTNVRDEPTNEASAV
jgi:hypothetical protein